jgi:hypothetical protein
VEIVSIDRDGEAVLADGNRLNFTIDGTYTVLLRILAPMQPMLELKFVVPDRKTAHNICKKWEDKAAELYSAVYDTLID